MHFLRHAEIMDIYNLDWNNYEDHVVGAFKNLKTERHFVDVTLISDDQIQTQAHKVVLSTCSPVLKNLLVNNPHPHPLLFLRGIKHAELQAILSFMYTGQTKIFKNRINEFLNITRDLQVQGHDKTNEGQFQNNSPKEKLKHDFTMQMKNRNRKQKIKAESLEQEFVRTNKNESYSTLDKVT